MSRTELSQWTRLWRELRADGDPAPCHRWLMAAYHEPTRYYHNLQHLEECLTEFERVRAVVQQPTVVEVALWFHDAVYDSRSTTNEEDSAASAAEWLTEARVARVTVDSVRQLVLCTRTHEPAGIPDAEVLIDIDLSIFGQRWKRFRAYEQAIRAEYAWVPDATFTQKRTEILSRFLQRPAIYRTEPFRERYELTAHANLEAALARLRAVTP